MIVLEGADGVGKTTLVERLPDAQDRSWVTDLVYRMSMPTRDWSGSPERPIVPMPTAHLVIIDPGNRYRPMEYDKLCADHGYSGDDYARVRHGYLAVYDMIRSMVAVHAGLFATATLLSWQVTLHEKKLVVLKDSGREGLAAAQAVIEAAN